MESTPRTQRAEFINAYIEKVHQETGLPKEQIETDLLTDAVIRAENYAAKEDEYPEYEGVKGGCGHSSKELAESAEGCGICVLLFVLAFAMFVSIFYFE